MLRERRVVLMPGICQVSYLGEYDYLSAYALQKSLIKELAAGVDYDALLLLTHPPIYTIGRKGSKEQILAPEEILRHEGIEVFETDRGGAITYHGPGQLVAYPVLNLKKHGQDIHKLLHRYEEVVIRLLTSYNLKATRIPQYPGVWVGKEKICALGIAISRWITYHGLALNVNPDLKHFSYINPCGIAGLGVTSLYKTLGYDISLEEVAKKFTGCFGEVFDLLMVEEFWMKGKRKAD